MFFSRVEKALAREVEFLRRQLELDRARIDKLTEALASRNQIPLIMPQQDLPKFEAAPVRAIEPGSGYFDTKEFPAVPRPSKGENQ